MPLSLLCTVTKVMDMSHIYCKANKKNPHTHYSFLHYFLDIQYFKAVLLQTHNSNEENESINLSEMSYFAISQSLACAFL